MPRAAEAMKRIGWKRPNKAGTARFDGQLMAAYVRGNRRKVIHVIRDHDGLYVTEEGDPLHHQTAAGAGMTR